MQVASYLKLSVAVALATIALKTGAWWLTGSVSLASDAMESLVNLAGATFALMMVSWAQQPADAEHPYGHGKAEFFSSGFEGVLILAAALAIVWAAVQRLFAPQPLEQLGLGLALSVASSALNGGLAWAMLRKAREARSMALEADARHLFTDVWTSAGVVLGLLAVHATGWLWLDPAIAIAVALNIVREAVHLVRRSVDGLMDRALDADDLAKLDAAIAPLRAEAVRFDHLVTRQAGQQRFAELHMHVPADWTLGTASRARDAVERALGAAVPGLRATVQLWPQGEEPHWQHGGAGHAAEGSPARATVGDAVDAPPPPGAVAGAPSAAAERR